MDKVCEDVMLDDERSEDLAELLQHNLYKLYSLQPHRSKCSDLTVESRLNRRSRVWVFFEETTDERQESGNTVDELLVTLCHRRGDFLIL